MLANLAIQKLSTPEEQEIAGYAEVMETVFQAWVDMPFSAGFEMKMWR